MPLSPCSLPSRGWIAVAAVLVAFAAPVQAAPKRPPAAAPSAPPSPLVLAAECYGRGDLACTVQQLEHAEVPPADAAERWRLLGFAAARLDRHDLARRAFSAWIGLSEQHRLERDTTAPAVYQDYVAALLERHAGELDLQPQVAHRPELPAPPVTVAQLPKFPPPPRSERDKAADSLFFVGLNGGLSPDADTGEAWDHVGATLGFEVQSDRWRIGGTLGALRYVGRDPSLVLLPHGLVQGGLQLWRAGGHSLDLRLGLGGGLRAVDLGAEVAAVVHPALRYHARFDGRPVGLYVEIGDALLTDGVESEQVLVLTVGAALQPPR